jgi:hypothetical protein
MSTLPTGMAVSDDVYTDRIVGEPSLTDRSIVHRLCDMTTVCGRTTQQLPHRIAAGYAAVISATFCPRCFPA